MLLFVLYSSSGGLVILTHSASRRWFPESLRCTTPSQQNHRGGNGGVEPSLQCANVSCVFGSKGNRFSLVYDVSPSPVRACIEENLDLLLQPLLNWGRGGSKVGQQCEPGSDLGVGLCSPRHLAQAEPSSGGVAAHVQLSAVLIQHLSRGWPSLH
ncbi:hypothetical protein AAFF_G00180960 [Aldrovandia affinis]|uniref:Uncharacterized protein n=1 Tax=Aldrovandia affinis TaxID=143900 RepID=A0AAD7SYG7_9TELE|nr:hypothetical protein AAFF_G00180960 [Aldrovandia affinis]